MTAPRITAEEIAVYEQRLGEEDITFDFVREILDSLYAARSELDRRSAQGGGVPEMSASDIQAVAIEVANEMGEAVEGYAECAAKRTTEWFRSRIRLAPLHPDTVEVSRAVLEHLVSLREPKAGEEEGELLGVLSHALRAQAQPATEGEAR